MAKIYSAQYLICNKRRILETGALLEDQGRIVEVGPLSELKKSAPGVKVSDYGDSVLLPAFINAHTHLELSLYPEWASAAGMASGPCSFVDWILRLISIKRSLAPDAMGAAIEAGLRMCLASGTAAVGDILSWYAGRSAFEQSPLRGKLYLESLGQDMAVCQQQYKKLTRVLNEKHAGNLDYGISPHSPYTIRPQYMQQLFEHCSKKNLNCATHIGESQDEVDFFNAGDGEIVARLYAAVSWHQHRPKARRMRPLEFLAEQGGLFEDQLLVHGVQLEGSEIEAIAAAGARLVLCPRSNAHLQVGTAPVAELKQAGVRLALGTDSLASNRSLSLWDELAFAARVYGDVFDAAELFELATSGGAAALGLGDQLGELKPGLRASFQVVPLPGAVKPQQLFDRLIGEGEGRLPETLVLDGRVVNSD